MNNAAQWKLYDEIPPADESSLAPVIPIKSVKEETKNAKPVSSLKKELKKAVPDFTEPVFRPRKHNMLL